MIGENVTLKPHDLLWPKTGEWFTYPAQHNYLRLGLTVADRQLIRKPMSHLRPNSNAWAITYERE